MNKQQRWLVATLALGLLAWSSIPSALGLNSPAVDLGSNPVFSFGVSGLIVPAGEDLVLTAGKNSNGVNVYYTIAGQYVRS